jgi:hypothetical protein
MGAAWHQCPLPRFLTMIAYWPISPASAEMSMIGSSCVIARFTDSLSAMTAAFTTPL